MDNAKVNFDRKNEYFIKSLISMGFVSHKKIERYWQLFQEQNDNSIMFAQYLVQENVISLMQVAAIEYVLKKNDTGVFSERGHTAYDKSVIPGNSVGQSYGILKDKVEPNALTEVIPRDSGDIANELTVLEHKSYADGIEYAKYKSPLPLVAKEDTVWKKYFKSKKSKKIPKEKPSQFIIKSLIGEGGMGKVYLAKDLDLDREVAIKEIRKDLQEDKEYIKRFSKEARTTAKLRHPNIVPIYRLANIKINGKQSHCIVMGYIVGNNLQSYLDRKLDISERRMVKIIFDIASALFAAHQQGIVHRDVKPSNIIIEEKSKNALLADFGLAKDLIVDNSSTDGIVGTYLYMSPEQTHSSVTFKSDIYSLGVVFYKMLTGKDLIQGNTEKNIFEEIRTEKNVTKNLTNCNRGVANLCMTMLKRDPRERPSARDVIVSCAKILQKKPQLPKKKLMVALSVFVSFFILLSLILLFIFRSSSATQVEKLQQIEDYYYQSKIIVDGKARFASLFEYFINADPALKKEINDLKEKQANNSPHYGITYISAPAGSGKGLIVRKIKKIFDGCVVGLEKKELVTNDVVFTMVDHLKVNGFTHVFSQFPNIDNLVDFENLAEKYGYTNQSIIVVDSIDEIAPQSSYLILNFITSFVGKKKEKNPQGLLHIFVLGRTGGFTKYYTDTNISSEEIKPKFINLRLPKYESSGDLELLVQDYKNFERLPEALPEDTTESFIKLAYDYPFVQETIEILSLSNFLISKSSSFKNESELEIKDQIFNFMVDRDNSAHNNPTEREYVQTLQKIAKKYAEYIQQDGYFTVFPTDFVEIDMVKNGKKVTGYILVEDVLTCSGLVRLSHVDMVNKKFRFTPFWLHRYLVEKH